MSIKALIKSRNLHFLHPSTIEKANQEELDRILRSVAYFRNFSIFKALYTLLYKSNSLTLDHYRSLYELLHNYRATHPKDFFVEGFSKALHKSININPHVKALYAIMIHNQLNNDNLFEKSIPKHCKRLQKSVADYYFTSRTINVAFIRKAKVMKINNANIIKSITKWNP